MTDNALRTLLAGIPFDKIAAATAIVGNIDLDAERRRIETFAKMAAESQEQARRTMEFINSSGLASINMQQISQLAAAAAQAADVSQWTRLAVAATKHEDRVWQWVKMLPPAEVAPLTAAETEAFVQEAEAIITAYDPEAVDEALTLIDDDSSAVIEGRLLQIVDLSDPKHQEEFAKVVGLMVALVYFAFTYYIATNVMPEITPIAIMLERIGIYPDALKVYRKVSGIVHEKLEAKYGDEG